MNHGWLSRLWRLILGLAIFLSVAAGSITYTARLSSQFACLRFNGTTLLDVTSGLHMIDSRPNDIGYPAASIYGSAVSPDQQHVAYLGPGLHSSTLYIQTGTRPAAQVADHIDYAGSITWSPDSGKLAYSWMADHRVRLAVVHADGSDPILVADTGDPSLYIWSSTGKYVTYLVGNVAQRHLALWSVDDHHLSALSQPMSSVSGLAFDASDQHVAFVWSDAMTRRWISVGSPDQPTAKQFLLPAASYDYPDC